MVQRFIYKNLQKNRAINLKICFLINLYVFYFTFVFWFWLCLPKRAFPWKDKKSILYPEKIKRWKYSLISLRLFYPIIPKTIYLSGKVFSVRPCTFKGYYPLRKDYRLFGKRKDLYPYTPEGYREKLLVSLVRGSIPYPFGVQRGSIPKRYGVVSGDFFPRKDTG